MEKELLDIPKDYTITKREFSDTEFHIHVRPHKRKLAVCSGCGFVHKEGYHSSSVVMKADLLMFSTLLKQYAAAPSFLVINI